MFAPGLGRLVGFDGQQARMAARFARRLRIAQDAEGGDVMTWFRYVRHADILAHEALGWIFVRDLGPPHNAYAVLMQWEGEGPPP